MKQSIDTMGGLMIIDRDEESSYGHIWYILIQADPQEKKKDK